MSLDNNLFACWSLTTEQVLTALQTGLQGWSPDEARPRTISYPLIDAFRWAER